MTTLQMGDKASRKPIGILKDVMIKIYKFSFPVDFMLLDVEEDPKIPLILGRPFMKIIKMQVDIEKGQMKVKAKDHEICFNMIRITCH